MPGHADAAHLQRIHRQTLRREHVAHLRRADAERDGAERAVRRGVTVAARDGSGEGAPRGVTGHLMPGVFAKDVILEIVGRLGVNGGVGFAYEYASNTIERMSWTAP